MAGPKAQPEGDDDRSLRPLNDSDSLDDWVVVMDGGDTEVRFTYTIAFTAEEAHLLGRASRMGDLDVLEIAKQAVLDRAQALVAEGVAAAS